MKCIFRFTMVYICVLAIAGSIAIAQDLQQQLTKLGKDAAVGYTSPLLSGLGNDLNSGIYYSADLHDVLGFDIGLSFAMSKITDADKTKIGKGMPDWTFGLNLGAEWQGFDLTVFFQGTQGNNIFDFSQRGDIQAMNRPSWMLGRWIGEGTSNSIPRMTAVNANRNWRSSDLYIKDGSYIRLKTLQLGYTLPTQWMKKVSVQKLRVYVSAENLLTLTKYDGFDPEIAAGDYFNIGVDKGIYPQSRTISVGANISF